MSCLWSWCFKTEEAKSVTEQHRRNRTIYDQEASQIHAGERFESSDLVERTHSDVLPVRDNAPKTKVLRIRPYSAAN